MSMSTPENLKQYIGLMSGTSLDGIDGVRVSFSGHGVEVLQYEFVSYSEKLRSQFSVLLTSSEDEIHKSQVLAIEHSKLASDVVTLLCTGIDNKTIAAIGNHGQTIRHQPNISTPYSLQLGSGAVLAQQSGIATIMDFRNRDIAAGGQGAPLVPAFHQAVFHSTDETRAIVNIGGIANLTLLNQIDDGQAIGFDTGPGNALMDEWSQLHLKSNYDEDGRWAKSGSVNLELLTGLMQDPYFKEAPPKSTGRDYFNIGWLKQQPLTDTLSPEDVQATLCELTALSIINAINLAAVQTVDAIYLCGGGAKNQTLIATLSRHADTAVNTTEILGLDPQLVEACAVAWLAKQALAGLPGNSPRATGANDQVVLGSIFPA